MQQLLCRTKDGRSPKGKPKVYFTCHPDDFVSSFDRVCEDIFRTHDCAVYYTENMTEPLPADTRELDLESMNLFVVPVTFRLMNTPNRAMNADIAFAKEHNIAILPLMFDSGIDAVYSRPENFGSRQYLAPFVRDPGAISYEEKLKKYLDSTLFDEKTAERVRQAFDAYIFLSYRKADRVRANELMKLIHSEPRFRDLAIWYDEFLTPGEAFDREIDRVLSLSSLFALAVTPNLTRYTPEGQRNYVMTEEYPKAKETVVDPETGETLPVLPVQLEALSEAEQRTLDDEFPDLPEIVDFRESDRLGEALLENLKRVALRAKSDDPEHNYLIGLAYLNGIDMETDGDRGLALITDAAEAELPEAMEKLADMYDTGDRVGLDYRESAKWWARIYAYYRRTLGEEHPDTLNSLNNLALAYDSLGDYSHALELNEKVYDLRCKVRGREHPDTLLSLSNLAVNYNNLGDHQHALELNKKAYDLRCKVLGEEHPATLSSLNNLAVTYGYLRDYPRALELGEKSYDLSRKVLGEEHPYTLGSLSNLALAYGDLGDHQHALELNKKAYDLYCKVLGEEHPNTLNSLNNLALTYNNLGDHPQALELHKKTYDLRCKVLGEEHPDALHSLSNLAATYGKRGDHRRQLELLKIVYTLFCKVLGEEHPDTLLSLRNLAVAYGELGDHQRQLELNEKAYALRCKVLGEEHPDTLNSLNGLALTCYTLENYDRALELFEKLYALRCKVPGEEHPDTLTVLSNLAATYYMLENYDRALELFEKLYALLCEVFGEEHPYTLNSLNNLAFTYGKLGDRKRASELAEKAADLRQRFPSP